METIGIIAEYNPFHNGHLYQINKIKEIYPESIIVLILNGYFLERGLVSLESKEEKTTLALKYGCDIVIENPFIFGSNSADIFASSALELLNQLHVSKLVFGSESNNINNLVNCAKEQLKPDFDTKVAKYMNEGINYPTALNMASNSNISEPNDLLGVSYIKAILENNYNIEPITIERTNSFHDNNLDDEIVSASNIRKRINNNENISKYIPEGKINSIDNNLLFNLIKTKILTDNDLSKYLTVDEGIENRLLKVINNVNSIEELVNAVKTKRYTYNRIMRMLIHILIGLTKEDKENITNNEYIRILGLTTNGQSYINGIKKEITLPLVSKISNINSLISKYEITAASIYQQLTKDNVLEFEYSGKPKRQD